MGRPCTLLLGLSFLLAATGCQLTAPDNLSSVSSPASTAPQAELPARKTAEVCVATAEELEKAGKDKEAISLYEKARQTGTSKPVGRRLAALYDEQKDYVRALEEYKLLLSKSPRDADLLNDIGYCYYNQGKWSEAEKFLRQALAVNAKHARAWINLGMALAQDHRYQESLEAFTKVVNPAQAQCNLAFIWLTQGKREEAVAAYRQALAMEPNLGVARAALERLERPGVPAAPAPMPEHVTRNNAEPVSHEDADPLAPIIVP